MRELLEVLSGIFLVAAFFPYITGIVKKETQPAKASWLIWVVLDFITLAGMYAADVINGQIVGATIGSTVVAVLALHFGKPGWTKLDLSCLLGAAAGFILWRVLDSPLMGILVSQGINFLGSVPTVVSAWEYPNRESRGTWILFWFSCVFTVASVRRWSLEGAVQPITFFLIGSAMLYVVLLRPWLRNLVPRDV
ncbi:MAG: hypothetical protein COU09_02970 [Candidatus Harrisonbacteria bacterium CG10_big_fil_rev_8_21_14_0_10_44_23]|uniref:Uncharacterized protein n=1 Tax=Candidatus Harrisonbacteria bacterium CG10_big_fil_rev_8_21_14_0_10_44_23 TaxID=1974585 RepID=A0A2H0UPJ5_9BACT|nr:MAG: hypothetical protein COU09_02970 [Candidatus Harrisonbacteria bacterium CG10_big_fil_rev_8_21_14_0_10_44_23]